MANTVTLTGTIHNGRIGGLTLFQDAVVLVTGGTGSFGHVMARRLLETGCGEVRIFSRDEAKQEAMRIELRSAAARFYIGDVRNLASVEAAAAGVDYVFHAAALKQVPSCEFFPLEAVATNVQGSANVMEAAARQGVKTVVCLSTDKAVYPVNAMGMSKALMEKTVQARARVERGSSTVVACVRYGNVMYSRGSVIPLMIQQIKRGQEITLTEPSMTRFMMPLSDSVSLVEFAFTNAERGDIFVKKAPACTMGDLVRALLNLFEADNKVVRIGIRHGEKLAETLASKEELANSVDHGDYIQVHMDDRDLNYDKYFVEGDTEEILINDFTSDNATRLSVPEVEALLLSLPEVQQELAGR